VTTTPLADQDRGAPAATPGEGLAEFALIEAVRALGTAHMVGGILLLLMVPISVALRAADYINTPLDVFHYASAMTFVLVGAVVTAPGAGWREALGQFAWVEGSLRLDPAFWNAMILVHINVAALNLAVGYGLRRLRPWSRRLEIGMMSAATLLAVGHVAVILSTRGAIPMLADVSTLTELFYSRRSWVFLGSVAIGAMVPVLLTRRRVVERFAPGAAGRGRTGGGRWRAALPLKLLAALMMGAVAPGILVLVILGPLVEVVGLVAWMLRGY
jgi:hypothetical protein